MEKYMIKVTIAFFFILFAVMITSMFYGISKIEPGAPAENQLNAGPDGGKSQSPGSTGNGALGTISPLSKNGSAGGVGGGGGSGGGGGGGSGSVDVPQRELPPDLYTAPCGIYFTGYGVCNGSCEEGICSQEGRSCYCKLV